MKSGIGDEVLVSVPQTQVSWMWVFNWTLCPFFFFFLSAKFTKNKRAEDKVEILANAEPVDYDEENASNLVDDLSSFSGRDQTTNGKAEPPRRGPHFTTGTKNKNIFDDV